MASPARPDKAQPGRVQDCAPCGWSCGACAPSKALYQRRGMAADSTCVRVLFERSEMIALQMQHSTVPACIMLRSFAGGIMANLRPSNEVLLSGKPEHAARMESLSLEGFCFPVLRAERGEANGPSSGAAPGQTANQTRRNGTGQLPACDLVGWLKIEAQGCREGYNGSAHTVYPQGGEAASFQPLEPQGKGGCRVNYREGLIYAIPVQLPQAKEQISPLGRARHRLSPLVNRRH